MSFLFRPHKGSLEDSMKEVVEMESYDDLLQKVIDDLVVYDHDLNIDKYTLEVEKYTYDGRIGWNAYIVTLLGYGVIGFTNGPVPDA